MRKWLILSCLWNAGLHVYKFGQKDCLHLHVFYGYYQNMDIR